MLRTKSPLEDVYLSQVSQPADKTVIATQLSAVTTVLVFIFTLVDESRVLL